MHDQNFQIHCPILFGPVKDILGFEGGSHVTYVQAIKIVRISILVHFGPFKVDDPGAKADGHEGEMRYPGM